MILGASLAAGQDVRVELQLDSTNLEIGEAVNGQLTCTNTGQPEAPQFTLPDGLDVQFSSTPSQSTMMSIVNGQTSQRTTYTLPVRVVGKKEGSYTFGPVTVTSEGKSFQTKPISITVRTPTPTAESEGDKLVFVRVRVEPRLLYVTQSYDATLTIGIRKVEIDGKIREVRSLLQFVDARSSGLSVFGPQFSQSNVTLTDSAGRPHQYVLYSDSKQIRAEQIGETNVGPVFIKVDYPTALGRDFFGDSTVTRSTKVTARAESVIVKVKGPPTESRPADFRGAVGHYTMQVTAKPTRVEQGKPVTISVALRGDPIEGIGGPDLARIQELTSRFDFTAEEPPADAEGDSKIFRKAIFPKQLGEQTIPALSWSYFDPNKEHYVTLHSDPIVIMVDPAAAGSVSLEVPSATSIPSTTKLTAVSGLSPNCTDVDALLADSGFGIHNSILVAGFAVPPIVFLASLLISSRARRLRNDPLLARRHGARQSARSRIAKARLMNDPRQAYEELSEAIVGYLSDHFGLARGELTPIEARDLLVRHELNGALGDEIVRFLEDTDAVRYSGRMTTGTESVAAAADQVNRWIREIERVR
ncbi:MAG: BatD family protein [Planctomycetes bacterium]|nr:BatD family protein [Planctomycetota bacterium]MBI3833700.1 BatD family protein [Planctomycetota bacterium]